MEIIIKKLNNENKEAKELIKGFWKEHNDFEATDEESQNDLLEWTKEGNSFFFIELDNDKVGFIHLGSRGAKEDWLEDIFVLPSYQNRGIGTQAIKLCEEMVSKYSESMYIEAAARNTRAISLYHKIGFDCLNTITVRKDFHKENFVVKSKEKIGNLEFEIKKVK